jgi:salicylate hydroxylase
MERVTVWLEPRSGVFIGPGHHLNVYPVQKGKALNLVAFAESRAWTEEGWSIPSSVDELRSHFQDWCGDVRAILDAIAEGSLFKWGVFDREPVEHWSIDHVALLGDAAHPVLPFLGHGAVPAIEDGVVLARAFAAATSIPEALRRYEDARRERARFVFEESRRAVRKFHGDDTAKFTQAVENKPVDEGIGLFAYDPSRVEV